MDLSTPRYKWWSYVKWCIRDYPRKCRELDEMHQQGGVRLDGMPRASGAKRSTESIALRSFSGQKEREYEGVRKAVEAVRLRPDGDDVLVFIELFYWRQTHTMEGAAKKAHMSYRTARRRNREFVMMVAKGMGLLDE